VYPFDYTWLMFSVGPLPEFTAWIDGLGDEGVRGVIVARIKRLERGLIGDVKPVGDGISELRIHVGAGWRLYFAQRGHSSLFCWLAGRRARRRETSNAQSHWQNCWIERRETS
jgi:putative addiction module killer protein